MSSSKKEWYYAQLGHRRGPVSEESIREMIVNQELHLDDAQIWKEGMNEWLPVGQVKRFRGALKSMKPKGESAEDLQKAKEKEARELDDVVGGLSRFGFNLYFYVGWMVVFFGAMILLKEIQVAGFIEPRVVDESSWMKFIPYGVLALFSFSALGMRMKNAGYSAGWAFGILIPFVNFWVILTSLCAPKNFKIRRRVGMAGALFFLLFLGSIAGGYLVATKNSELHPVKFTRMVMGKYESATNLHSRYSATVQERAEQDAKRAHDRKEREAREARPGQSKRDKDLMEQIE